MLINIITLIAFLVAFVLSQIHFMHMFQLNSYNASEQFNRMGENIQSVFVYPAIFITATMGFVFEKVWFVMPVAFLLSAYITRPKKAKKPLVYTKRVLRMFATEIVLMTVVFCAAYFLKGINTAVFAMFLLYLLSPIYAVTANLINKPIELCVKRHFINDAKKILKACPNLKVIGVTGSYGKTSMKYYLSALLKAKYNVLMTPESYNTPMGIVMTVRGHLSPIHEIFVCEMGAKRVGEIKELCDIVSPNYGVITSIGPQHLESFKSLENIKKTKFELSDALPEDGILFLNGDDENVTSFNKRKDAIVYSLKNGDYHAFDISVSEKGTSFSIKAPNGEVESFSTKLIGEHNVLNITGAIAIAHTLGIELSKLKPRIRQLECVPHRLELKDKGNSIVIDDAYNSNPSGTKAALATLSVMTGFKILITPGMVELGEKQDECNFEFGKNAAKVCDFVILVGKRQTESIKKGLEDVGYPKEKYFVAETIKEAINKAYSINTNGQKPIILLENDLPDNY